MRAVGIQEGAGQIRDGLSSPVHHKARLFRNNSDLNRLEILFVCVLQELIRILRRYYHCHPLLGFGDCQLCAVKTRILLRNLIQVDPESGSKFTDGNGNTACAKVVALLDDVTDLRAAEHSLQLPLCRRITFLDLCAAGLKGLCGMNLGGSRRSADSVTAGSASEQNDDVARVRIQPLHRSSRSRAHHRADLHTLRHVIRVVDFLDIAGCKTNLVSVGAVAVRSLSRQRLLRKFALHGFRNRNGRVRRSSDTHCLIHIGSSGKRITDRAAQTGRSAAEGFNLCRMVVRLIFEIDEPLLILSVYIDRNDDAAGIYLI